MRGGPYFFSIQVPVLPQTFKGILNYSSLVLHFI